MNCIWVLSVKTSLPNVCTGVSDLKTEMCAFENFGDAKNMMRKKLKEFAFAKNAMFDGNGHMIHFARYTDSAWEPEADEDCWEGSLTKNILLEIQDALKTVFEGNCYDISSFRSFYADGSLAVNFEDGVMTMQGDDDGPFNGYDSKFACNMFDMCEEKDYYLYIDDLFGQDEATSELYIEIRKARIQ